jgi:nitrite reductase/ring-hydroxylating ferredoxin subunit
LLLGGELSTSDRLFLCREDDLSPGCVRRVELDPPICLARTADGTFWAILDRCSHEGGLLSEGDLIDSQIECPEHMSRFELSTGRAVSLPAKLPVQVFAVSVEAGSVYLLPGDG